VEVEMLSRFRSPQQQKEILDRLDSGALDIVIGTHRLLSGDVVFKDLGLLIIDEEQRFGVTHKEKLKQMRTEVDVLTMTATPIPRTLYMTLTGVRDISTIDTPPEERLPIITHVGPYTSQLVRQAIIRELERGGQVFFVHNRVQTIGAFQYHLRRLVPEARITVAHGQMHESELSQRMKEFAAGEIDVLLSTSIIESGLDIPNANTLIVDRADTFGLAQLYQLRGRVGRGAQRAYAYFFKHRRRPPTQDGLKRLETIAENTQLGAGFSIAMRDLEIRGAGDILGTRQHGHIAMVGFHLYTRLLAEAIKRLRQERGKPLDSKSLASSVHRPMITVDLPLDTNIPAEYVLDRDVRLGLYRRMADLGSISELEALADELADRFGVLPTPVENLIYLVKIKLLALDVGLENVSLENNQLVLRLPDGVKPPSHSDLPPEVRVGKTAYWVRIPDKSDWMVFLLNLLIRLKQQVQIDPKKNIN
jgi:transcription-repair coupling factor (superfamily II helicase)